MEKVVPPFKYFMTLFYFKFFEEGKYPFGSNKLGRFRKFLNKRKTVQFPHGLNHTSIALGPGPASDAVQTKPVPSVLCHAAALL
jgi:hypothetical protein